jgi:ribonuclease HII
VTWVINTIAGIDEAGRGPLAGPVVAAVVVLDTGQAIAGVRDSKLLTPAQRSAAAARIRVEARAWAIGEATRTEIDELNILQATFLAMQRAFAGLALLPARVEVDGNRAPRLPGYGGELATVVDGDQLRPAIAAASVLAKVHRDALMDELDARYPGYGFHKHRGYGTAAHRAALEALGPCPEHRRSFAPVQALLRVATGVAARAGSGPEEGLA